MFKRKMRIAVHGLLPIDMKSVGRDSMLRWMLFAPLLIGVVVRIGVPIIASLLDSRYQMNLVPYYPLVMSLVLLATPMMYGMVVGFLLLDQRDDRTLTALQVTPLSLNGYIWYRLALPVLLAVFVSVIILSISGLIAVRFPAFIVSSMFAALLAPAYALFLASFANNKVQGFALMKASSVLTWPPLIAYFVESPWQLLFGLFPTYWPTKIFWDLHENRSTAWISMLAASIYFVVLYVVLLRRFRRVMESGR